MTEEAAEVLEAVETAIEEVSEVVAGAEVAGVTAVIVEVVEEGVVLGIAGDEAVSATVGDGAVSATAEVGAAVMVSENLGAETRVDEVVVEVGVSGVVEVVVSKKEIRSATRPRKTRKLHSTIDYTG